MPKVGIDKENLIIIDTRPFACSDPITIPINQVIELLKKQKKVKPSAQHYG